MGRYDGDVLAGDSRRRPPPVPVHDAEVGLVVEDADGEFCGAVVGYEAGGVILEDRHRRRRLFPLRPGGFLLDGRITTLRRPTGPGPVTPALTASGSLAVGHRPALVAQQSRIWVEGDHDAALVERVWGDDLRVEGIVVEALSGVDHLDEAVRRFGPGPGRRLGVLVDHLVPGSKESRIAAGVSSPHVLVTGHPYVDIWEAVRPAVLGLTSWPRIPPGQSYKDGVCAELARGASASEHRSLRAVRDDIALGVAGPAEMWRRILSRVDSYRDLEPPLIGAVERLIDHVTEPPG